MPLRTSLLALTMACLALTWPSMVSSAYAEPLEFHTLDIPPFGFKDGGGTKRGMLFDIAKAITAKADIEAAHSLVPLARVVKELQNGRKLCTIVTRSPFSEAMSNPFAYIGINAHGVVIGRETVKIKTYDDLKGLRIAVTRGTVMYHPFDNDASLDKRFTNHTKQGVLMLQRKRVDAVAGALEAIQFNMASLNIDHSKFPPPLILVSREFWLHCAKDSLDQATLNRLGGATKILADQGVLRQIWDSYLRQGSP